MKGKHWHLFVLLGVIVLLGLLLAGCATTYEDAYMDIAMSEYHMTEDEALVALFSSYSHLLFKEEDGKWDVDYSKWPVAWVENFTSAVLGDLDWLLTCKPEDNCNCRAWHDLILALPGFKDRLLREWEKWTWLEARVRRVVLWEEFQRQMGGTGAVSSGGELPPDYSPGGYGIEPGRADPRPTFRGGGTDTNAPGREKAELAGDHVAYDISIIWPETDLEEVYPFTADYVESAKKEGTLKAVGHYLVLDYEQFGTQEVGVSGELTWESTVEGLEIISYMVRSNGNPPTSNAVQYVEVYRCDFEVLGDGVPKLVFREDRPAIRGFMTTSSKRVDLLVVDIDRQGTAGYGVPDIIKKITGITTGRDLYLKHRSMLRDYLFQRAIEEAQRHEFYIPEHSQELQIVYRGQVDVKVWEDCPAEGCQVPYDYLDHPWMAGLVFTDDTADGDVEVKQILYFTRQFSSVRQVTEYYKPLPDYAGRDVLRALAMGHSWEVWVRGKPVVEGGLEIFAQPHPYMVEYTDPADDSLIWRLVDDDGDGQFDRRRAVATG